MNKLNKLALGLVTVALFSFQALGQDVPGNKVYWGTAKFKKAVTFESAITNSSSNRFTGSVTFTGAVTNSGSNYITGPLTISGMNTNSGTNYASGRTFITGPLNISGMNTNSGTNYNLGPIYAGSTLSVTSRLSVLGNLNLGYKTATLNVQTQAQTTNYYLDIASGGFYRLLDPGSGNPITNIAIAGIRPGLQGDTVILYSSIATSNTFLNAFTNVSDASHIKTLTGANVSSSNGNGFSATLVYSGSNWVLINYR